MFLTEKNLGDYISYEDAENEQLENHDDEYDENDSERYARQKRVEILTFIRGKLLEIRSAHGRENREALCVELFNKLSTPLYKLFTHLHPSFSDVVKKKLIELYTDPEENFKEAKDFYRNIFDEEMPVNEKL